MRGLNEKMTLGDQAAFVKMSLKMLESLVGPIMELADTYLALRSHGEVCFLCTCLPNF